MITGLAGLINNAVWIHRAQISLNRLNIANPTAPIPINPRIKAQSFEPVLGRTGGAVAPRTGGGVGLGVLVAPQPQPESSGQLGFLQ